LGVTVGPITVRLEEELVLEPDLVFVRQDRMSIVDPKGHIHGPPDLVVAILSPSRKHYDRTLKRKRYLDSGVGEVWIIDIDERMVEGWRRNRRSRSRSARFCSGVSTTTLSRIPLLEVFREL
jgi:Uma2 family endonuclease